MAQTDILFSTIDTGMILSIGLTILIAIVLIRVLTFILIRFSETLFQYKLTIKMMIPLMKYAIYGIVLYHILANILKVSSEQLLGLGVLLGAAIGFGIKDLFADIMGGIVITLERPYQVGDKISIGEYYGEVKDIGLRSTRLVTPDDNLVSAPNFLIFTQSVASANAGNPDMMVVIDIYIDHGSDEVLAMKMLREAVVTSRYVYIDEKHPVTILVKQEPYYRRLRAKAYVNDLRHEFRFQSDVTLRAWKEYSQKGIKPPEIALLER